MTIRRVALLAAVVAVGALSAAQTAAASWLDQPTPAPPGAQVWNLGGVSCASASACETVGSSEGGSGIHLLAESRSGATWTIQSISEPAGASGSALNSISCRSATNCVAVGDYVSGGDTFSLAEGWNGSSWTVQSTPNPAGATDTELSDISCGSTSSCVAVGHSSATGNLGALAEAWNGSGWKILTVATPAGASSITLGSVWCTSGTACVAVGSYVNGTDTLTLAEVWNGSSWSIQSTPNPISSTGSQLNGVSCTAASACTAVADGFAERWNGTSWSLQTLANPGGNTPADLSRVSCSSATACVAVGGHYDGEAVQQLVVEAWNGTSWRVQNAPISTAFDSSDLSDVSCTNSTYCTAVGIYHDPVTGNRALVELDALRWQLQDPPNPSDSIGGSLDSVSCNGNFCQSIGNYETSSNFQTVAEGWSNNNWSLESTPNPTISNLSGVSCTSQTECTAVGDFLSGASTLLTLGERWNGTSWSTQSTPNPPGGNRTFLLGVSCPTATACIAVGYSVNGAGTQLTLAEHWNGTSWTIQATPNPTGSTTSQLLAVSCTSATACAAVGHFSGTNSIFSETWNGTSWTMQTPPTPSGGTDPYLDGVSCTSASACTAVGQYFSGSNQVPLAERWNGTSWTVQSVPPPNGATLSGLKGVSCPSATSCSAVGWSRTGSSPYRTLAEHWTGTSWSVQASQTPNGAQGSFLQAVSCAGIAHCTAVGYYDNASSTETFLAELYS